MIVGSSAYMAPERFTTGSADARSDVYALACVLYECLTGDQPYPGRQHRTTICRAISARPAQTQQSNPAILAGFDEVIARGMAKNPDERYQSAHDLATAAHHALTAVPTPPATRTPPRLSTRRDPQPHPDPPFVTIRCHPRLHPPPTRGHNGLAI